MKLETNIHFYFLLLNLFPLLLFGQDPYYINYDTKDGLPSSEVYAVEVDSNGMVWFATDRGVCSYNGYEFITYTTEDGLANNTVLAIWKDRKGNFWFPGLDGSLSIYDHNNHNVINLDDILYLKAMAGYSMVMVENESKHISTHPLNYFEDLLPENQFFRIHKSYLINCNKVIKYDN